MQIIDVSKVFPTKSDQLNSVDVSEPRDIKVTRVEVRLTGEQRMSIYFDGDDGKPYKPCKEVGHGLVKGWGADISQWAGKYMRLYTKDEVTFNKDKVGGIRVSHMSDVRSSFEYAVNERRGKKKIVRIEKMDRPETQQVQQQVVDSASIYQQLAQFAQRGMIQLRQAWASLSDTERMAFNNTCPADLKQMAEQADAIAQQMQDEPRG